MGAAAWAGPCGCTRNGFGRGKVAEARTGDDPMGMYVGGDLGGSTMFVVLHQLTALPASQVAGAGVGRSVTYAYDSSLACADALRGTDRGSIGVRRRRRRVRTLLSRGRCVGCGGRTVWMGRSWCRGGCWR